MPTYDYKCDACGHAFEHFQTMTSDPIRKCPSCGKMKVKRLIGTGAGLIFKGSGFYITDYRDQGYKDKAKADSGADSSSGNGEAAKSDAPATSTGDTSKPAAADGKPKAESKPATPPPAKSESKPSSKKKDK
jgi:putative FmdB family regulatory protein